VKWSGFIGQQGDIVCLGFVSLFLMPRHGPIVECIKGVLSKMCG
jgi:hypothetical protein